MGNPKQINKPILVSVHTMLALYHFWAVE